MEREYGIDPKEFIQANIRAYELVLTSRLSSAGLTKTSPEGRTLAASLAAEMAKEGTSTEMLLKSVGLG